jgi:hypothetical protein
MTDLKLHDRPLELTGEEGKGEERSREGEGRLLSWREGTRGRHRGAAATGLGPLLLEQLCAAARCLLCCCPRKKEGEERKKKRKGKNGKFWKFLGRKIKDNL